jgi:hypothetical protein
MPVGNAPQCKGIDAVVEWYENADIPAFAVCYVKDINLRYMGESVEEGAALLRAYLEKVKDFDSKAIYQLRLYEDLNGKTIRSNTPYDMAFKFVLNERDQNYLPAIANGDKISNTDLIKILGELSDLKAENAVMKLKLDQYEEEEEGETDQEQTPAVKGLPSVQPSIGQVLIEKLAPALTVIGERLVDVILPQPQPGKVNGIAFDSSNIDEEKLIEQSLKRLKNAIPDNPGVAVVLMKLADLAEREPATFNFYLTILMKG